MKIKELEKLLGMPRANIRYYEKEGLINPDRGGNGYRDYNEQDIERLKQIIIFRKIGISVADIKSVLDGELKLSDAVHKSVETLQAKIDKLNGSINLCKQIEKQGIELENFNEEYYWNEIQNEESKGNKFADILNDFIAMEIDAYGHMWKYVFFHNFEKDKKKYGIKIAVIITIVLCLIRGFSKQFILKNGTFLEGFLYPFAIFAIGSIFLLPLFFIKRKSPKAAGIIATALLILCIAFLSLVVLFLIILIANSIFHFWF